MRTPTIKYFWQLQMLLVDDYNVQIVVLDHQILIQGGPRGGTIKLTRAGEVTFAIGKSQKIKLSENLEDFPLMSFL